MSKFSLFHLLLLLLLVLGEAKVSLHQKKEYVNCLPNEKVRFFERFELSDLRWKQRLRYFAGNKAPEPCLLPLLFSHGLL